MPMMPEIPEAIKKL